MDRNEGEGTTGCKILLHHQVSTQQFRDVKLMRRLFIPLSNLIHSQLNKISLFRINDVKLEVGGQVAKRQLHVQTSR